MLSWLEAWATRTSRWVWHVPPPQAYPAPGLPFRVPTSPSKVPGKVPRPRQKPVGMGRASDRRLGGGGALRGPAERGLIPLASRARPSQSHGPSANMVLFSRGGRALGQAWILSIASPCRPWGSRTYTSQAKSAWNPFYEAPGAVCVCARGSPGVCLCKSPRSSFIPCSGEGRREHCSPTPAAATAPSPHPGLAASPPWNSDWWSPGRMAGAHITGTTGSPLKCGEVEAGHTFLGPWAGRPDSGISP